jgi:hypothetical protein
MPNRIPHEQVEAAYLSGAPVSAVAAQFGILKGSVYRVLKARGTPLRGHAGGPNHPRWRGGRIEKNGYIHVWIEPNDPMESMIPNSNKTRHVLEHRLVMARHLGRPLRDREQVHHKNGIKSDNRIENLQLVQGPHGNGTCYECADCGSRNVRAVDV